jgi:hypothetical protein
MARVRDADRDSGKRSLALSAALLAALDALRDEGVDALPLKGPALAAYLYPDPALRPSSDIDLLVHRPAVPAAFRALSRLGYALEPRLGRLPVQTLLAVSSEVTFRNGSGVPLDLHWEIAPRGYPFRFDAEILWRAVRPVPLDRREVPGLDPEALLLFLCVHGAKHLWSQLMWLGDIARLAQKQPDWTRAMDLAVDARCMRPLLLGLLLAHDLVDAPVPRFVLARARFDGVVSTLAREATLLLSRIPPVEPASETTRFNARLAERRWDRAKHYATLLAPAEADLVLLSLPAPLRALYYPFRIARLATKYTLRMRGRSG